MYMLQNAAETEEFTMIKLPLNTDLSGKVAVVTGAGGVLCGMFAQALAQAGAKVAVLDLNEEADLNEEELCKDLF